MAGLWDELTDKLGSLAGKWTSFAALGTFVLYLFGYLMLRFKLATYGVAVDVDVFDERYLFAGCAFLVYLASSVPVVLTLVALLMALVYVPYKLVPASVKAWTMQRGTAWAAHPARPPLLGILLALGLIQFVLRRCYVFGNLLFASELPDDWISAILLTNNANRSLYFSGLVGGTLVTAALLLIAGRRENPTTPASKLLMAVFAFLVAMELLLLPVNYGTLIASQELPRVAGQIGDGKLSGGEQAWLVWESKEAMVFFIRTADDKRSMITVPKKDLKMKFGGYDAIFRVLFGTARGSP